jgi:predicted kinase
LTRYKDAGVDLPEALVRFYWAHQALVRAKVACLKRAAADSGAVELAVKAADYLDLASAAAVTVRPVLIAMTGLSGTGKSTVARRLARVLGAPIFTSDVVRKELAGVAGAAPAVWREGIYSPEWTTVTYERLFALAEARLAAGAPAVLDAAFLAAAQREGAAAVAARHGVLLVLVETVCDEATVAARLAARAEGGASPSDATLATHRRQRAAVEESPPPVPAGALAIRVDTAGDQPVSLDPVFAALQGAGIVLPVVPSTPVCAADARSPLDS